ncbi:MAG: hypothetical protein DMF88_20335 [Acidobacteria bacterium]|nr:MAG: hypothetical protein DMF88_20335 [Acidobacteriota bacterium]
MDAHDAEARRRRHRRRQHGAQQAESRQRPLRRDDRHWQEARRGVERRSAVSMMRSFSATVLAAGLVVALAAFTALAQSPGRWLMQKGAPVPAPEEEYWNATANGKLYLMGGNQGGKNDRVLEYDIAADKWTTKKPAPWSANHMALVEYRGKIYVFGGATVESQPNALKSWEYDPAADSWKELPPMPSKRTASVAIEAGGRIYVIGGSDETGLSVATNEAFDVATGKWETHRPMPTARNHPAGGSVNGKLYVIGGRLTAANVANMLSSATDIVEEYDPATDTWRSMTKMPYQTSGQGWITFQNRIYRSGGERVVSAAIDADRAPRRGADRARQPHSRRRRAHRLQRQRRRGAAQQRQRDFRTAAVTPSPAKAGHYR